VEFDKGQILELVLHSVHAEPLGQRRVYVHRFTRYPPAALVAFDKT